MSSHKLTDIGLLVAVPLTEETLRERREAGSDYVGRYSGYEPAVVWRELYEPEVVRPVQRLCDFCNANGAEVITEARLSHLNQLCQRRSAVIVFAHWKGPEVGRDDLLSMCKENFLHRLMGQDSQLALFLTQSWEPAGRWFRRRGLDRSLADVLNDALDKPFLPPSTVADVVWEALITRRTRIRQDIDELFDGLILPGNRLEFFDGLHRKDDVASAIPSRFTGFLDLLCCTSMVLAGHLQGCHRKRFRIAEAAHELLPVKALAPVERTLEFVIERGVPYGEARMLASKEVEWADRHG